MTRTRLNVSKAELSAAGYHHSFEEANSHIMASITIKIAVAIAVDASAYRCLKTYGDAKACSVPMQEPPKSWHTPS